MLAQKHPAGGKQHVIVFREDGSIVKVGCGGEREAGIAFGRPSCRDDSRRRTVRGKAQKRVEALKELSAQMLHSACGKNRRVCVENEHRQRHRTFSLGDVVADCVLSP